MPSAFGQHPDGFMPGAKLIYSITSNHGDGGSRVDGAGKARALEEAPRAEVRLYDTEFEPSPLQPGATSVGFVRAVAFDSTLRRLYAISCALEVGYAVLARLRPRALLARPLRPPGLLALLHPHGDGRLELLPSRHCFT